MSDLPESVRIRVQERANHRCEYCLSHQDLVMGRLQVDHIQPLAKGGSSDDANLRLACELCNQHKWTTTEGPDPENGEITSLFHPASKDGLTTLPGVTTEYRLLV